MIVLDTNILSELMRPNPEELVCGWLATQPAASVFTTTINEAEVLYGVALLPRGARRTELETAVSEMFREDFAGRLLTFDSDAAHAYAAIASKRKRSGRPIAQFDAQIASICNSRGAELATRNVKDFTDCGITLVNPWEA